MRKHYELNLIFFTYIKNSNKYSCKSSFGSTYSTLKVIYLKPQQNISLHEPLQIIFVFFFFAVSFSDRINILPYLQNFLSFFMPFKFR